MTPITKREMIVRDGRKQVSELCRQGGDGGRLPWDEVVALRTLLTHVDTDEAPIFDTPVEDKGLLVVCVTGDVLGKSAGVTDKVS
jgi:hypothetical protein